MQIDIVSDTICPWCYIGKRRFDRALSARGIADADISWRAFQLNPDMPAEGVDRHSYMVEKFGSEERVAEIFDTIERAGAEEGIDFAFDRMVRTPNTVDSHRLIAFAGEKGMQNQVVDALFHRYFERAEDIGDQAVLVAAGTEGGLDEKEIALYLAGEDGTEEILAEARAASSMGISGVPCFIFDKRYAVSGAQAPEVFDRVFELATKPADEP